MSVNYVALGKRIGYFRMQCGNITQEALASKINRSREFLAKIEKGTEHPSVATLVDIADALCISIDDLLIDSLHYSVSTSNTELHRLLLDCNETNQKPSTPENTPAITHHDKQKQVEVKRSSRASPHEIRLFSGCPYYFTLPMDGNNNSFPKHLR